MVVHFVCSCLLLYSEDKLIVHISFAIPNVVFLAIISGVLLNRNTNTTGRHDRLISTVVFYLAWLVFVSLSSVIVESLSGGPS